MQVKVDVHFCKIRSPAYESRTLIEFMVFQVDGTLECTNVFFTFSYLYSHNLSKFSSRLIFLS